MLENYLIITPVHLPWNWSADYQRQTIRVLSRHNLVIVYMQENAHFFLKKKVVLYPHMNNVFFFTPLYIIPFRRFAIIERLNQLLNILFVSVWYGWKRKKVILWIFDPVFYFYPLLGKINKNVTSFYDCVDFHWSAKVSELRKIRIWEKQLIRKADYFFVNSHALKKIHEKPSKLDAIVPLGFRMDDFLHPLRTNLSFPFKMPIIGYIGALDHRLDFRLFYNLVNAHSDWQFVLWGPIQELATREFFSVQKSLKKLREMKNVIIGESKDKREVSSIIQQFDVAIIPYDVSQNGVRYAYPMKLFEYFYMGKPVVSTPIEELKRFPKYVRIGSNVEEWERHIRNLLARPWPERYQNEQRRLATENSWENKLAAVSRFLE